MPNIITIIPQEFKKDAPYPRGYIMHLDPASKFTLQDARLLYPTIQGQLWDHTYLNRCSGLRDILKQSVKNMYQEDFFIIKLQDTVYTIDKDQYNEIIDSNILQLWNMFPRLFKELKTV